MNFNGLNLEAGYRDLQKDIKEANRLVECLRTYYRGDASCNDIKARDKTVLMAKVESLKIKEYNEELLRFINSGSKFVLSKHIEQLTEISGSKGGCFKNVYGSDLSAENALEFEKLCNKIFPISVYLEGNEFCSEVIEVSTQEAIDTMGESN